MHFRWLTPPRPYRATTWWERELTLDHIHTFLTTQGHGEPPQMSDQLNARATSEATQTLKTIYTSHALIHSNKADMIRMIMMAKWYLGNHGGLKLPDICLRGEEKPRKKPHPGNLSLPGIEPGPAAWQVHMLPLAPQWWAYFLVIYIRFKVHNDWVWWILKIPY